MNNQIDTSYSAEPMKSFLNLKEHIIPEGKDLVEAISNLKKEKDIIILSDYYQSDEIQHIADFSGDSLELIRYFKRIKQKTIAFCGSHFMAEVAKAICPDKKIIVPNLSIKSLRMEEIGVDCVSQMRKKYPNAVVVSYVNCDAELKAISDIMVTSSNASQIIETLPKENPIIFISDEEIGYYLSKKTNRKLLICKCFSEKKQFLDVEKIKKQLLENSEIKLIIHNEYMNHLLNIADFVGSASEILEYIESSPINKFIIAAEKKIVNEIRKHFSNKDFISALEQNNEEKDQKNSIDLEKIYLCIRYELPEIHIKEDLGLRIVPTIEKMLKISSKI